MQDALLGVLSSVILSLSLSYGVRITDPQGMGRDLLTIFVKHGLISKLHLLT